MYIYIYVYIYGNFYILKAFGLLSRMYQPLALVDNINFLFDSSRYQAQPHSIIVYYGPS